MKLNYKIIIDQPSTHTALVTIKGERKKNQDSLIFFLPRWSPGSYLIREYSRHLSFISAQNEVGEKLHFEQVDISSFELNFNKIQTKNASLKFEISYKVYCKELTVRTSHIDQSHAFLHLPTLLMGVLDQVIENPEIEICFPPIWTKLSTSLKDISTERQRFIYQAEDYDQLIDCPIEIGCHETDGFKALGVDHHLAFYGQLLPHFEDIKRDTKKIVETIGSFFGPLPYQNYLFLNHFVPGLYGGLEHSNSTALHFCPIQLTTRKGYLNYLCLVSHEYFHLYNVKRIRPIELGPFDYLTEAKTKLLWLAEGLTSLMDELFVYRAGLMSLEEYLDLQKDNLNRYLSIPGRKFHSLNDSSFNAWIKLYRPDENTNNSSVSYYLKGGIVFWLTHLLLIENKSSINQFLIKLWEQFQKDPSIGIKEEQIYQLIEDLGGKSLREKFETMTTTTEELKIDEIIQRHGLKIDWEKSETPWMGCDFEYSGDRVIVKSVVLDGPAYRAGLNAGDEILAINNMRMLKERFLEYPKFLRINEAYQFMISRMSKIETIDMSLTFAPAKIKSLLILEKEKVENSFKN